MTTLDWCYTALIAASLFVDHFVSWPAFLRRAKIDAPSARLWLLRVIMAMLWALTLAGMGLWLVDGRAWQALGMTMPEGWPLWGSLIFMAAFTLVQTYNAMKIARTADPKAKLRAMYGELAIMLPHAGVELCWFFAVSLTAGFCEEFLFRGYLIWAFEPLLGWWGAAAVSLVMFTAAHLYQGRGGAIQAGILGAGFTLIVLLTGSLLPAIALHALIDASSGVIAWLVLRDEPVGAGAA
jgi:membrane protease YdiL (CAAX protease family)